MMYTDIVREEIIKKDKYGQRPAIDAAWITKALDRIIEKINQNIELFGDRFPSSATKELRYELQDGNFDWTEGFWSGMLWLAYEVTRDVKYRSLAERHIDSFLDRLEKRIKTETHDLGFLYILSCVSAYKVTGNQKARKTALLAADLLLERYHPKAGIIQAWGNLNDPERRGRMIIDCNLNVPLLYWASEETGDKKYFTAANEHIHQAAEYLVRQDASTFHTYFMDVETGMPLQGKTHQGYSDDSCWARGQAWAIYGFALNYLYTKDTTLLEVSKKTANYFLNRLPEDDVCYWDLIFIEGAQYRDTSGAAVAACGLLEISKHLPIIDEDINYYQNAALWIIKSLEENYATANDETQNGLLLHALYNFGRNMGIDESCLWGDYYYFEALVRISRAWNLYW